GDTERLHEVPELIEVDPHAVDGLPIHRIDREPAFAETREAFPTRLERGLLDGRGRHRCPRATGPLHDAADVVTQAPQVLTAKTPAELPGPPLVLPAEPIL